MAYGDRKAATEYLVSMVDKLVPGGTNRDIMQQCLDQMSDKEFDALMKSYEDGTDTPNVFSPNFSKESLSLQRNLKIGEELGIKFFERIYVESADPDQPSYLTPIEFMIVELPMRRLAQMLVKKQSVAKHNKAVDQLTGQASGDSKAGKISYPELLLLKAMGLEKTIVEMYKYRGGDIRGFDALNTLIQREGGARQETLEKYSSGVESTATLKTVLTCMHLENTL